MIDMLRIESASALGGLSVKLTLTDGSEVERDLTPLLVGPIFEDIVANRGLFEKLFVEAGTLAWPNGVDLDPDMIIYGGPPPSELRVAS